VVHSFAGDDALVCKDHVRARLGLPAFQPSRPPRPFSHISGTVIAAAASRAPEPLPNTDYARRIWRESVDIFGTIAEIYLASRLLILDPAEDWHRVLRFHPACPFGQERAPAMIALMRDILTDAPRCIQRTRLTPDGHKIDRQMLGPAKGAAIKIDPDAHVTMGLVIGEGLETCLTGRQIGLKPCWALGSANAIGNFPALAGIETLSIHAENDDSGTNQRERQKCIDRWIDEGREVLEITPKRGNDLNDTLREARRG
jgi:hypothetical protein